MFTRTITLLTKPSHQIKLHFKTHESARKLPVVSGQAMLLTDDFGQEAMINMELIASDVTSDIAGHHAAGGEMDIATRVASKVFCARVNGDKDVIALYEVKTPEQDAHPTKQ